VLIERRTEKPHFIHDCERCIFLGNYSGDWYDKADLYWCKPTTGPTVIVRYGDDGPEYSSGMVFAKPVVGNPALLEAKKRALEKGLDCNGAVE